MSAQSARAVTQAEARIEIASYRDVFDLERRIYRIDRLRLNPGGIPLRGAIYFVVAVLLVAGLGGVPVVGWLVGALPWYLRYAALPGLVAAIGATVRVEGRPFHLAMRGLLLQRLRPRQLSGFVACPALGTRWRPPPIILIPDGSGARARRFRFTGPGTVVVRCAHECVEWQPGIAGRLFGVPDLTLRPRAPVARSAAPGRALALAAGVRLDVEPRRGPARVHSRSAASPGA